MIHIIACLVLYIYYRIRVKRYCKSSMKKEEPLRILFATEYLPPYISGIANRCKNWINGYRQKGHKVTVYSINGSDCDHIVPSIPNPLYNRQRIFILPPPRLLFQLLNPFKSVDYDVAHIVAPTCFSFLPLLPLFWLRGIKIYVSYHVYLEYYAPLYLGDKTTLLSRIFHKVAYSIFTIFYYLPLTMFAECVGVPSKTADRYVFDYSKRIHVLKSGLDVGLFHPDAKHNDVMISRTTDGIKSSVGEYDYEIINVRDITTPGPVLLYCGRLAKEKNVLFLIQAMANPLLCDATLVIVGDGPIRQDLESVACSIVGMILDERKVASYYAQADIFVSASASETFGFTVAEAMACGTPAVVVRSGAFPTVYKMIDENMFEVGDESGYVRCILNVLSKLQEQSKNARLVALNGFSVDASIDDLISTYHWILDECT